MTQKHNSEKGCAFFCFGLAADLLMVLDLIYRYPYLQVINSYFIILLYKLLMILIACRLVPLFDYLYGILSIE